MPRKKPNRHYRAARLALAALVPLMLAIAGWQWLQSHPQHNPWAPLNLNDPPGWATRAKLARLKGDVGECRAVLERSDIAFTALEPTGEGPCARSDRTRLGAFPLAPDTPPVTCPVAAALEIWRRDSVAPAARQILGSEIRRIEHLGAFSCRRMYGDSEGPWSEHATANAIDIAAFVLKDGRRISVLKDWEGDGSKARFLRAVREGACGSFATVLSPDYNAAHADHFHLDQDDRWAGVCR
ncbi:extensin family protein [Erythrobacter sp. CCH5-A1]|jgi:hypothetical protein|uniref:extensin-like domain-containing protein n=1 Tax=Erythrobacter sp. CCH5-A1 TaxID=1768792 RepID=UPI0008334922|nr:extensin family protein [Erythrobacter sp. CCH5-A1]